MIDLRVLGPIRVLVDGHDLDIGHARQRGLLAMLLVEANNVVPFERLVELLWDERPPRHARNVLAGYAARLRKALADLPWQRGIPVLSTRDGGYALQVDPGAVDLLRFREALAAAAVAPDDRSRADALGDGLLEWGGAALGDLWGTRIESLRASLEAERCEALLAFYDAELRLGRARDILPALQRHTEERPYDEGLALRLISAHRDTGNRAEALRLYGSFRRRLAQDLSARPGAELREAGELLLQARPMPETVVPAPRAPHLPLPRRPESFVGRERELRELDGLLDARGTAGDPSGQPGANLFVISGIAGSGKTTLAVQWAHRARESFPDGRFFVSMRSHHPHLQPLTTAETLARILLAMGLPAADIPYGTHERAALYRTLLVGRRLLLVLDDATGADHVRDLLPPSENGSAVVVTCRNRVPELTARYGAREAVLDVLDDDAALLLLGELAGADRVAREPAAAADFVRACGQLPLTVRLSGAFAASRPQETLARLLAHVTAASGSSAGGTEAHAAMTRALHLSYRRLTPAERRIFRCTGLVPGADFGTEAVAVMADCSEARAEDLVAALVRANLLTEYASRRYRLHDMVKQYAAQTAADEDPWEVREAVLTRLLGWYRSSVEEASSRMQIQRTSTHRGITGSRSAQVPDERDGPDGPDGTEGTEGPGEADGAGVGIAWLDREKANLCAAIKVAAGLGLGSMSWRLADAMVGFIRLHPGGDDWFAAVEATLDAARKSGDPRAYTATLLNMSDAQYRVGDAAAELGSIREALDAARRGGWRAGEGLALASWGRAHWSVGEFGLARRRLRAALQVHQELGDTAGQANALARIARIAYDIGPVEDGLRGYLAALELSEAAGSRFGRIRLPAYIALTLRDLGRYTEAERRCEEAIALCEATDFHEGTAIALTCRAAIHSDRGAQARSVTAAREAHVAIPHLSDPRIEADCLIRLGCVELVAERPDLAMRSLGKALRIAEQVGYRQGEAHAHAHSAAAYVRLGLYEEALVGCRRSRRAMAGLGLRPALAMVLVSEADCALASGRCAQAVSGYRRAAGLFDAAGQPLGTVRALLAWGRAAYAEPGHGRPERPWRRALRIAEPMGVPETDQLRALLDARS